MTFKPLGPWAVPEPEHAPRRNGLVPGHASLCSINITGEDRCNCATEPHHVPDMLAAMACLCDAVHLIGRTRQ